MLDQAMVPAAWLRASLAAVGVPQLQAGEGRMALHALELDTEQQLHASMWQPLGERMESDL